MEVNTVRNPWRLLRAAAHEDGTALNLATKGDIANKPAGAKRIERNDANDPGRGNIIQIAFAGGAAENKTFKWRLYAWRDGGMAVYVGYGTGTLGAQAVIKDPLGVNQTNKFWADTLVITAQYWGKIITVSTGGHDGVATLLLDMLGFDWFYLEIYDADGTSGSEAGDISGWYSVF